METPERKRTVKIRVVLFLLMALCISARALSIGHAWITNFAFVDLSHAILRSDDEAATRFERWACNARSARERDAAVCGMVMLMTNEGRELPRRWLQEWISSDSRLMPGTLREQIALYALTSELSPSEQVALVSDLDAPAAARWLITVATRRPEEARVFVRIIEDRGLASALSLEDRVGLATVVRSIATLPLESHWRGSTEEVVALANRSLDLDPQNEMGIIVKAAALSHQGQLEAGLVRWARQSLWIQSQFLPGSVLPLGD